jgi:putative tricarboxylic transport membrane protein
MRELKSGFFFFGLSVLVLWESLRTGLGTLKEPGSGFLSVCAGVALSAFSLVLICRGWKNREKLNAHSRRALLAMAALLAYSLLLESLGFLITTFLLVAILLQIGEHRRWWIQAGLSALITFLVYLVFGILLHVYFPQGFLMM